MPSFPPGALDGIRVIDLTQVLAGPFCTQILADHGAEVLKVEPLRGDETRRLGPYRADDELRAISGYYQSVNRNKKSIALDLKTPEGRQVLLDLIDGADAVVENSRGGVMERLDLSYELLSSRNPKLVYAAIRGFGDPRSGESPYAAWPAFDIVGQAMGGMMGITGPDADTPIKVGPGVGDLIPGLFAVIGIVMALMNARQLGAGQFVDVSMVDCVLATSERIVNQYSYTGRVPCPEGNRHPLLCPYGVVRAADGWLTLSAPTDAFWRKLLTLIARHDLVDDARYSANEARLARQDEVYAVVEDFTRTKTKAELTELFGGVIPFGPIYDVSDIFTDPHFRIRDMLVDVDQPGSATPVTVAGVPIKMSLTPGRVRHRAPLLGEHTREILGTAGYAGAAADRLFHNNIVK
ncbi:CaiB/BaiF CoA transferase family protein [Sphingopyxis sp. MSC1_008]|jgi:crotonobetainyl-CoA:carnitine CoA-transferase CaiB-like acyl-CoA transferase|uniref:CaiB/BaiF CoA transferase family protein n=1 Tax=Sphingopyxis sp. MSC1_008 TaxID=2909265 RepID=UPI0024A6B3A2|nr:CoA transferase [Sphingopyxis sp. MSC1_008]